MNEWKKNKYIQSCLSCDYDWFSIGGWNIKCPRCRSENLDDRKPPVEKMEWKNLYFNEVKEE